MAIPHGERSPFLRADSRLIRPTRPLFVLATTISAAGMALASEPVARSESPFRSVFDYCQNVGWSFDPSGNPAADAMPEQNRPPGNASDHTPDQIAFAKTVALGAQPESFMRWLSGQRSAPGESAFVAGWDDGGVLVLSEHGSAVRCLKRYDIRPGAAECLTPTNAARELLGPILLPSGDGTASLAGVRWRTESGTSNEWYDARMAGGGGEVRVEVPAAFFPLPFRRPLRAVRTGADLQRDASPGPSARNTEPCAPRPISRTGR